MAHSKKNLDGLIRQQQVEQRFSWFSPSEIFSQTAASICRTGKNDFLRYMEDMRRYRDVIVTYLKEKKVFEKYIYFTPQDQATFVPTAEYMKGNNHVPDHFNTLDLKNVPLFIETPARLNKSFNDALSGIAILIFISLLLLSGSIFAFNRYQLR